jgi:hypothetical protein
MFQAAEALVNVLSSGRLVVLNGCAFPAASP